MRLTLALVISCAWALAAGCATVPHPEGAQTRPYATGDLTLLVHYTAKESCSCLYVQEMPEAFCHAYTKANPAVASWSTDAKARTVTAGALALWSAKAHFVDEQTGCVLDD